MPPSFARYALADVRVGSLLDATRELPGPNVTVEELLAEWTVPGHTDYVVASDGEVVGVVHLALSTPKGSARQPAHDAAACGDASVPDGSPPR